MDENFEIEILKRNIRELEEALHASYERIADLIEENLDLKHVIMLNFPEKLSIKGTSNEVSMD